ncbi:hypothetical protein Q5H93_17825 [Hymenobacter sp. ASUV-10]|uniref:Lipoprotein n=1 Tax=Hymenobacter aranciens TaxID=3063996 RepID=A0ABT9BFY9_9BACT|nr:hypothetical protein [Hymenobacter sp. ASUV-10]MDO7876609.1 hypothetical protein [Hymenobacter sp. ASUV-10]
MRTSTLLLVSLGGLLTACTPVAKLVFGIKNPRPETPATATAFVQQELHVPTERTFLATTALYATPGSDSLLYPAPGEAPGAKAPGSGRLYIPILMAFDGDGRGIRATFTGQCATGHPNRVRAGLEQLPASFTPGLNLAPPALGAYKLNADFNSVAPYFTRADGQPLRFETVRNGSQAYIGVFGAKFMPKITQKLLRQAEETARLRPDLRVTILYFNCDFTPESYAVADSKKKPK